VLRLNFSTLRFNLSLRVVSNTNFSFFYWPTPHSHSHSLSLCLTVYFNSSQDFFVWRVRILLSCVVVTVKRAMQSTGSCLFEELSIVMKWYPKVILSFFCSHMFIINIYFLFLLWGNSYRYRDNTIPRCTSQTYCCASSLYLCRLLHSSLSPSLHIRSRNQKIGKVPQIHIHSDSLSLSFSHSHLTQWLHQSLFLTLRSSFPSSASYF
jgi:hypothetical protein